MNLFDRNIATKEDLGRPWSGNKENFRCGICGHRFNVGDGYRMIFTNNLPSYGGNPICCDSCASNNPLQKWKENIDEFNRIIKEPRFWRMVRELKSR